MGRFQKHYDEVVSTCWNYAGRVKTKQGHEQNAIMGLSSEAGEALDIIKKYHFHTEKDFDKNYREKLLSELGDVVFYWMKAVHEFGFTFKEILDYNRKKLSSRHPEMKEVTERFGEGFVK